MKRFFRAVAVGTLAGAWMPLIITVIVALATAFEGLNGKVDPWGSLLFAISPAIITFPIVLFSSIFIGLPAAWVLRRLDAEQLHIYVLVGIIAGSIVPLAILWLLGAESGWWIAALGTLSGAMTAASWFKSSPIYSE